MNKQDLIKSIANSVKSKHPWRISQEKYLTIFKELPKEFLLERLAYDNLLEKAKTFKILNLVLSEVKVEITLTYDELISWELQIDKHIEDVKFHNVTSTDVKKYLKDHQ